MPDFRKVLGPFGRTVVTAGGVGVSWGFIGILADYETAHWTLTYRAEHRDFFVHRSDPTRLRVLTERGLIAYREAGRPVHKDMFIRGDNHIIASGTITNVLRARLRPEDLALCAQLSMRGTTQ